MRSDSYVSHFGFVGSNCQTTSGTDRRIASPKVLPETDPDKLLTIKFSPEVRERAEVYVSQIKTDQQRQRVA